MWYIHTNIYIYEYLKHTQTDTHTNRDTHIINMYIYIYNIISYIYV